MRGGETDIITAQRIKEVRLVRELHISPDVVRRMSPSEVEQYITILDESHKIEKEEIDRIKAKSKK